MQPLHYYSFLNPYTCWNYYLRVKIIQSIFCLNQRQFEIYVLIANYLNKYPSKHFAIAPLFFKATLIFLHFWSNYASEVPVIYPIIWKFLLSDVFRDTHSICVFSVALSTSGALNQLLSASVSQLEADPPVPITPPLSLLLTFALRKST